MAKVTISSDSRWVLPVSYSILKEGNVDLNEYQAEVDKVHWYGIELGEQKKIYNYFPPGTSLLATPLLALWLSVSEYPVWFIEHSDTGNIESAIASLWITISSILLFLICKKNKLSNLQSFFIALVFSLGTPCISTGSRALWSNTSSLLFITIILYLLHLNKNTTVVLAIGICTGFLIWLRPTNIAFMVCMGGYMFLTLKKRWLFFAIVCLVVLLFPVYSKLSMGKWIPLYYLPQRIGENEYLWNGFKILFFSPNRGLLIFSPVILFSLFGLFLLLIRQKKIWISLSILATIACHFYIIGSNKSTYGGWCIGPRILTETMPLYFCILIFAISEFNYYLNNRKYFKQILIIPFFILSMISIAINTRSAYKVEVFDWNSTPTNIDEDAERVWDWKDWQVLRGI